MQFQSIWNRNSASDYAGFPVAHAVSFSREVDLCIQFQRNDYSKIIKNNHKKLFPIKSNQGEYLKSRRIGDCLYEVQSIDCNMPRNFFEPTLSLESSAIMIVVWSVAWNSSRSLGSSELETFESLKLSGRKVELESTLKSVRHFPIASSSREKKGEIHWKNAFNWTFRGFR